MRLIDADALRKAYCEDCDHEAQEMCKSGHICATLMRLNEAPTIEAEPVKHGRWLKTQEPLGWRDVDCVECSVCHDSWIVDEDFEFADFGDWDYCPSCGAKMMEGEA